MHNIENDEWFVALVKSGRLHVGEDGVVYNPKTKRNIGAASNGRYLKISFQDETGTIRNILIHRLVWLVHKGPIPQGQQVNHIDLNTKNPALLNLELTTPGGNMKHAMKNGVTNHLFTSERASAAAKKMWRSGQGFSQK